MISTGFTSLDGAIGGLAENKNYLIYGPVGSGKSGFALNFLRAGLTAGEVVALVTRRSPRMVLDHSRTFGWDFESFVSESRLILLEYPPKILQNTAGLGDENQIVSELHRILEGSGVQRIVFDPLSPILEGTINTNVVFRCRSLLDQVSRWGSTNLYVMDIPESDPYINQCKDQFHGMLRLERRSEVERTYRLTVERTPTLSNHAFQIDFQLQYHNGRAELSPVEFVSGNKGIRRKVLAILPPERRPLFRTEIGDGYSVIEAESPVDGMAKIAAFSPDLIVIDSDSRDINGLDLCQTLRVNGLNMPIIVIGEHLRRARDRVEISAVGADACLQRPFDGRLLNLEIQSLLHRYDPKVNRMQGRLPDTKLLADLKREGPVRIEDPEYFFQRLEQEVSRSSENDLSFSVLLLRPDGGRRELNECATTAASLVREYDVIFTADRVVAVLLPEADQSGAAAFLKNFFKLCKGELQHVACRSYQQQSDFIEDIRQFLTSGAEEPCEARKP
jgi:KaiC/GvpD/RAD55 family RecA-like ATPase/DNA-binding response OmpR family regulator